MVGPGDLFNCVNGLWHRLFDRAAFAPQSLGRVSGSRQVSGITLAWAGISKLLPKNYDRRTIECIFSNKRFAFDGDRKCHARKQIELLDVRSVRLEES